MGSSTVSFGDKIAAGVVRFNRTLKPKICNFLSDKQTSIYIVNLLDFIKSNNHSFHIMICMRPAAVREKDQDRIWVKLYGNNLHRPRKPSVAEKIARISKIKGLFDKGCAQLE